MLAMTLGRHYVIFNKRRLAFVGVLSTLFVILFAAPAFAADKPIYDGSAIPTSPSDIGVSLNMLWVVIGAVLVIFMQAGFALVETGFCRAKHASHVISTNFAIFGLGFVGFFLIGFPLMFSGFSLPGSFGLDQPADATRCHFGGSGTGSSCGRAAAA